MQQNVVERKIHVIKLRTIRTLCNIPVLLVCFIILMACNGRENNVVSGDSLKSVVSPKNTTQQKEKGNEMILVNIKVGDTIFASEF